MTARVAGTPIETARDDGRERALILSDLHVVRAGGFALDGLRRVLEDAQAEPHQTRVLILGDLFDVYVGAAQMEVARWSEVVAALAAATAAGVRVTLLHGNRDYMLDPAFAERTGCRVVAGGLSFELAGRPALALHGDELCLNDLPYQRAKRFLRHPLTRAVLRRVPLGLALKLAGRARRESNRVAQSGDQGRFAPVADAAREAFAGGAELLVFGHIHRAARGTLGPGCEYCVLPAFDEAGIHLLARGGEVTYRDLEGRTVADFPPLQFA